MHMGFHRIAEQESKGASIMTETMLLPQNVRIGILYQLGTVSRSFTAYVSVKDKEQKSASVNTN